MNITFAEAAESYLKYIANRNRRPARAATIRAFESRIRVHVLPRLGEKDISTFGVLDMRDFVNELVKHGLSPQSTNSIVDLLRSIIRNVRDEKLNSVFPQKFDSELIDLPQIVRGEQRRGTVTKEKIEQAIASRDGNEVLYALACNSGLRIGEIMALRKNGSHSISHWRSADAVLAVRTQLGPDGVEGPLKTASALRDVELSLEINAFIVAHVAQVQDGDLLFPFSQSLARLRLSKQKLPGFHSFRRFYMTSLVGVPDILRRHWMGHSVEDVHQGYDMLASDPKRRREIRDATPPGFTTLPTNDPT